MTKGKGSNGRNFEQFKAYTLVRKNINTNIKKQYLLKNL